MLIIPKILDRWILKTLANYPDVYQVSVEKKPVICFWVSFWSWSQSHRFLEYI